MATPDRSFRRAAKTCAATTLIALLGITAAPFTAPGTLGASPASTFYAESDWDDPMGDGHTAFGTSADSTFNPSPRGRNSIWIDDTFGGSRVHWSHKFDFTSDEPLVAGGTYGGGVDVRGPSGTYPRSCDATEASVSVFEVHEVAYDTAGDLSLLSMSVQQRCGAGDYRAEVRFNTSLPTFAGILPEPNPYYTWGAGTVTFPSTAVGAHSAKTIFELTSVGSSPVQIGATSITGANPGDFSIHDNDCSTRQLAPGQTCTFAVRFDPTALAGREALASIGSDTALGGRQWLIRGHGQTATTTTIDPPAAPVLSPVRVGERVQPVPDDWPGACMLYLREDDATSGGHQTTCDEDGRGTFDADLTSGQHVLHVAFDGTPDYAPSRSVNVTVNVLKQKDWATVSISPLWFYPVVDQYRDTLLIEGTRGEAVQAHIAIRALLSGDLLEETNLPAATGDYRIGWDGRDPGGTLLPAGNYDVTVTLSDAVGNTRVVEKTITLSHDWVTWKKRTVAKDGRQVSLWGWSKNGGISFSESKYSRGARLNSGKGFAAVVYTLPVKEKRIYGWMGFGVYGRSMNKHKAVVAIWNPALGGYMDLDHYDAVKQIGSKQRWWTVGTPGQGRQKKGKVRFAVMVWKGLGGTGKSIFDVKRVRVVYKTGWLHSATSASVAALSGGRAPMGKVGRSVEDVAPYDPPSLRKAPVLVTDPEGLPSEPQIASEQPSSAPSPSPTEAPEASAEPSAGPEPAPGSSPDPSVVPVPGPDPEPTETPTPEPDPAPTGTPDSTPAPETPAASPPTAEPTPEPTADPEP